MKPASGAQGRPWLGACLAMLALVAGPLAAAEEAPPVWNALSAAQKQQLAPLRVQWPSIDATRKQKWLNLVSRFNELPTEERSRIQQRMAEWARLQPAERSSARQQFQEASQLSADERHARWLEYQALSADQRKQLSQQAQQRHRSAAVAQAVNEEPAASRASRAKSNVMPLPETTRAPLVAPAIVQARPGATTNTVAKPPQPAQFQQAGLPKIAATPDFVDPTTLLPRRGAQAAAAVRTRPAQAPGNAASAASSAAR